MEEEALRKKAKANLRAKRLIDFTFIVLLILPFAGYVFADSITNIRFLEDWRTPRSLFIWVGLFVILIILETIIWRCPRCLKHLSKWYSKSFILTRECPKCGYKI